MQRTCDMEGNGKQTARYSGRCVGLRWMQRESIFSGKCRDYRSSHGEQGACRAIVHEKSRYCQRLRS